MLQKLMKLDPEMYAKLIDLTQLETVDGNVIYEKDNKTYKIPQEHYKYWDNMLQSYNTKLVFTMTIDPKYEETYQKNINQQKDFIDKTLQSEFQKHNLEYIYTYELQRNGNVHVHGILCTDHAITYEKIQKIRSNIRKLSQDKKSIKGKSKNRIIIIEPIKNFNKCIAYCLKEYSNPVFPYTKRLKSNNSNNVANEHSSFFIAEVAPQLSLRSEDDSEWPTVTFN